MKWLTLFNKIGKQPISVTRNNDVRVLVNNQMVDIKGIRFDGDGIPFLVTELPQDTAQNEEELQTLEEEDLDETALLDGKDDLQELYEKEKERLELASDKAFQEYKAESTKLTSTAKVVNRILIVFVVVAFLGFVYNSVH